MAPFVVVITPPRTGGRVFRGRVGGLSVPLRLVLAAQRGGAAAVHLVGAAEALAPALVDERVSIAIRVEPPPDDVVVIEVASDLVVHEGAFAALAMAVSDGRARFFGQGDARVEARPPSTSRSSLGPAAPLVFAPPFAFPPVRVASRRDAMRATTALLRACRKPTDGWTATYLNRYVSLTLTRLLLHTAVRPNHLTAFNFAIGVASGIVAARGTHDALVYGAALLQLQSTLDGCDGELARMTYRQSKLGEWLDSIGDDVANYAFFAGAGWGLHRFTGNVAYLALAAAIVGCGALASAIEYRYLARMGTGDLLEYPILEGGRWGDASHGKAPLAGRIAIALQPLFKRDTFILVTFLAAAIGLLGPILAACALGALAVLVTVLRTEARLARRPSA